MCSSEEPETRDRQKLWLFGSFSVKAAPENVSDFSCKGLGLVSPVAHDLHCLSLDFVHRHLQVNDNVHMCTHICVRTYIYIYI